MKVKELLSTKTGDVITITADQSLYDASQLLTKHNIGAVVVVDADDTPVGILSERDIVRKVAALKGEVVNQSVGETMTKNIFVGLMDDDLSYVSKTMTNKHIRHLPIMDGNRLVGMVSIGDVVKAQLEDVKYETDTLRLYISGGYA